MGEKNVSSFSEFAQAVYQAVFKHAETIDDDREEWKSELWGFIRDVKSLSLLANLQGETGAAKAFGFVEAALSTFTGTDDGDPWERHLAVGREDAEVQFLDLWDRIKYTGDLWLSAAERAERHTTGNTLSPKRRTGGWPLFVAFAAELQLAIGTERVTLPQVKAAEALGVSQMTVSKYIRWAKEEGWLLLVENAVSPYGGRPGRAAGYLVGLHLCPALTKRAAPALVEWLRVCWNA